MSRSEGKQKLYCYVDETGQDTLGAFFLVAIVLVGAQRDRLEDDIEEIERDSKRGILKWRKSSFQARLRYISAVLAMSSLSHAIYFSLYEPADNYPKSTADATAKAIVSRAQGEYQTTVIVDGLSRTEEARFAKYLRESGIKVLKVRGMRDESDSLVRLADSMAGFVRDALEGEEYAQDLYRRAIRVGVLRKV